MKKIMLRAYKTLLNIGRYFKYIKQFIHFNRKSEQKLNWGDRYPILGEDIINTEFDKHYVYHTAWAARILQRLMPEKHIDISSDLRFVTLVSAFLPVDYYDFRLPEIQLYGLKCKHANITKLPLNDLSVESISCMHVAEHIGLGRYGNSLDPEGDHKAVNELIRVLARNGNLLFVVPIGYPPTIHFNAHRVYTKEMIIKMFNRLDLIEFALISDNTDHKTILLNPPHDVLINQQYGCGCFWFKKR